MRRLSCRRFGRATRGSMHRRAAAIALCTAAIALCAAAARAQGLLQYDFAGVVTDDSGDLGVFGAPGVVAVNDVFTGRFSYLTGSANPDQQPGDPKLGFYNLVEFVIDQAVVSITPFGIGVTHEPGLPTLPPAPPDLGTDRFSVVGTYPLGPDVKAVSLRLEAPYQTVFSDDSLPTSLALGDFTESRIVQSIRVIGLQPGFSQIDEGQITSLTLVPEPSAIVSCLVGLSMIVASSKKRAMVRRAILHDDRV